MFHLLFLAIKWVFRNAFNFALILAVLIAWSWLKMAGPPIKELLENAEQDAVEAQEVAQQKAADAQKVLQKEAAEAQRLTEQATQSTKDKLENLAREKAQAEANAKSLFEVQMQSLNNQKNTIQMQFQKELDDAKSKVERAIADLADKEKNLKKAREFREKKEKEWRDAADKLGPLVPNPVKRKILEPKEKQHDAAKAAEKTAKTAYKVAEGAKNESEQAYNKIQPQLQGKEREIAEAVQTNSQKMNAHIAEFARRKAELEAEIPPKLVEERKQIQAKFDEDSKKIQGRLDADLTKIQAKFDEECKKIEGMKKDFLYQLQVDAKEHFWSALLILLGIIISPTLVRAICYYVLAPLASKLPPVCVLPNPSAPAIPPASPYAVSLSIHLTPDKELLIHQGFLQTCDTKIEKRTKWFLNPRMPFTSISSGMCKLTQLRCRGNRPTQIDVAAQNNVSAKLATIELPRGAAMVVHPRSLAGVVKSLARSVRITRHWRLFSLHAWLTLQLRYIVLHGPCTLILQGCGGVKAEAPGVREPRMINQAATIGFSANLEYKNIRCETFMAYNDGKENLFNDQFSGGRGVYLYEELPDHRRASAGPVRILQSTVEVALRALGI